MHRRRLSITLTLTCLLPGFSAYAQTTSELKRMTLEELLGVPVTTVTRQPEQVMNVPAAVFVITGDDIRRSGATSIPEALRLAPGIEVSRISAGTWSIGMRGFADRLARSMLVLIDGRAVYSPLFAGTYWETQDTVLADIDRIEVIRGPGGTLWGANAVNGIINIITKSASDTQGLLISGGGGTNARGFGTIRYGGTKGDTSYRAYIKGFDRVSEFHPDGLDYDHWRAGQGGFRLDRTASGGRTLTLQGDAYDGRLGERPTIALYTSPFSQTSNYDAPLSGGNIRGRMSGDAGARGNYQLQLYYDRTNRTEIPVAEHRDTFDVDFQDVMRTWQRNTLSWGGGYRVSAGRITSTPPTSFDPTNRTDQLFTAFLQDEIDLAPGRLRATVGSKFEHNSYSGFEAQPSARLLWTISGWSTAFAAVSHAVRTPSRVETDYTTTSLVSAATPSFVRLLPDPDFRAERLNAYELGYRAKAGSYVYATVSGFYNDFDDLLSTDLLTSFVENDPTPRLILPVEFKNGLHGNSHGVEATGDVRPATWWRLTGSYSYLDVAVTKNEGSKDVSQESRYEGLIPHQQARLGVSLDAPRGVSFDVQARHVSQLKAAAVPGYTTADIRIGWQLSSRMDVSIVGQDLFDNRHVEWPSGAGANIGIERSLYARVTFRR